MKRSPFLILLLILSSCTSSNDSLPGEAGSALLVAEPWYEDFESGTVSSWFSYPPFQDTAFDFTLIPGWHRPASHLRGYTDSGNYNYPLDLAPPEDGGTYYLLRAHRPNSGGPQKIGLAYKKALLTGSRSTTLSFDYWLQYPVDASGVLRVELSGSDGRRYSETIPNPEPAVWQNAELQLSDFESEDGISLDGTTEINAVAIYLDLDKGDPSSFVFVALDNVKADAYQQAGFELATPETHQMTHWPIEFGKQHFHPGDELQIDTRANLPLVNVEATLLSLFDEPLAEPLTLTREGENRWQYDGGFTLPEEALGPITLRLEGRDQYGQIARTDVRLWNTEPAEADRPRVLFSDSSRQEIRDKIASSTRFSTIWNRITRRAEASRENPFPEQVNFTDLPNEYLFNSIGKWSEHMGRSRVEEIFDNALVWHIDRDPDARQFAIDSMLRMAGWEQWIHPWFTHQGRAAYYPIGHAVKSIGLAYDLLYDELTSEQRAAVRQGVMKNGIIPIWNEYASDNRIPNNTSNWISMAAGGTLVGLMAFHDELHLDGWERDGEPWFSPLAEKMFELSKQTMLSEGSYGEGIGYQHITYSHAQSFMAALDHQFGVRGLAETLNYTKGHLFWLYISLDRTQDALAMGDSNPRRGALDYWSWFARESDNELLKWFYAQRPGAGWMALLWDEEDAHEQGTPPEEVLPNSMVFPEKGNVVFRTGWDESDAVFVYRSGPFFNHTHFEQGHFRFYAAGEELVTEPGRASYYSDPYFWSYFIQPAAHNTIL
ncbi:MAG: heparinase II/III family protein, partial [Balneolaceae bacterium]